MSRGNYSQGKRQRDADKAQRKREKAERRALKREQGPAPEEFTTMEAVVGNLPSSEEALRNMEMRSSGSRAAATLPCRLFVSRAKRGLTVPVSNIVSNGSPENHGRSTPARTS